MSFNRKEKAANGKGECHFFRFPFKKKKQKKKTMVHVTLLTGLCNRK